ncbi:MAG: hypothetical protein NWF06_02645 [Candidatus Bathyarchaeota archaeon]|nr:hypothetical protein [Candidatus Bathyarchaeum sp.]
MFNPIVQQHLDFTVDSILKTLGKTNVVSIVMLGSWARGRGICRMVNGKPTVESDYDLVVIVPTKSYVKSLWRVKALEKSIMVNLQQRGLSSHVSIFITTFTMLQLSKPSIRFMDLRLNGKVLAGKDVLVVLPSFSVAEIPYDDIVLLLLNRMAELLDSLSLDQLGAREFSQSSFRNLPKIIEKGYFVLIQASLLCNKTLIYRGTPVDELDLLISRVSFKKDFFKKICSEYKQLFYYDSQIKQSKVSIERLYSLLNHWNFLLQAVLELALSRTTLDDNKKSDVNFLLKEYCLNHKSSFVLRLAQLSMLSIQYHSIKPSWLAKLSYILLVQGPLSIYIPLSEMFFHIENIIKSLNTNSGKTDNITKSLRNTLKTWELVAGGYLETEHAVYTKNVKVFIP